MPTAAAPPTASTSCASPSEASPRIERFCWFGSDVYWGAIVLMAPQSLPPWAPVVGAVRRRRAGRALPSTSKLSPPGAENQGDNSPRQEEPANHRRQFFLCFRSDAQLCVPDFDGV